MKQEDKELLLKDLFARLPYNPMVEYKGESYNVLGITYGRLVLCKPFMSYPLNDHPLVEEVKPYLFPLSSMTDEQKEEMVNKGIAYYQVFDGIGRRFFFKEGYELYDWLNKNHFDYRGLIKKSLAIDATDLEIYK